VTTDEHRPGYHHDYYVANKEKRRAQRAARYWADPEREARQYEAWRQAHKPERAEAMRRWRALHPGVAAERERARRAANPERARESARAYRAAHPHVIDRERAYNKQRYAQNREAILERRRTVERAEYTDRQRKRRLRERSQFVEEVSALGVLELSDGICGICGDDVDPTKFEVDHIIPVSRGGEHSYANVQAAHPSCNRRKWVSVDTDEGLRQSG
jgi:5-methylcytosine-specific restriction endonuclease McrA